MRENQLVVNSEYLIELNNGKFVGTYKGRSTYSYMEVGQFGPSSVWILVHVFEINGTIHRLDAGAVARYVTPVSTKQSA